ncbi:MAG: hypothetical protein KAF27_07295 [Porphyrobacter sp.]|nr:hypothetical protein [Porphyrobacter sp.]
MNYFRYALPVPTVAIAATLAVGAQAGVINSNLRIEAGQTFELGGGQPGGFLVTGRNTGPVAVVVLAQGDGNAAPVIKIRAEPGAAIDARFGPGEAALLRNTSATKGARLQLRISGDTSSLGMTYSANP